MGKPWIGHLLIGGLLLGSCAINRPSASSTEVETLIRIGGSSETYDVLETLMEAYTETSPEVEFEFYPPSQTSGGIQGVKSNTIDIGGVSRVITAAETTSQMVYVPLVQTPLVITIHNSITGIENITGEQIKAIYNGEIDNWKTLGGPDEPIVLLDFTEDENEKKLLRQTYLGSDLAVTSNAITFAEDDELVEAAAITEYSIAAVPYESELEDLPLTILTIDNVAPSVQTIQSGDYPMALSLGVVLNKPAAAAAQSFIEFANGADGKRALMEANYIVNESD